MASEKQVSWSELLAQLAAQECTNARLLEEHGQQGRERKCADYCPTCSGTGLQWPELSVECPVCPGDGKPWSVTPAWDCEYCHGSGRIPVSEDQVVPTAEAELMKHPEWVALYPPDEDVGWQYEWQPNGAKPPSLLFIHACRITAVLLALGQVEK